jgi:hypothetical protein
MIPFDMGAAPAARAFQLLPIWVNEASLALDFNLPEYELSEVSRTTPITLGSIFRSLYRVFGAS